jgi:type I restriction enzyme M protein
MPKQSNNGERVKSLESWIWDAACSIRGATDAAKYKVYIIPLISSTSRITFSVSFKTKIIF